MGRHLLAAVTTALALAAATGLSASPAVADPRDTASPTLTASPDSPGAGTLTVGQRIANGDGDAAGKCLDIQGGVTGNAVQMWPCNGGRHQDWNYVQAFTGVYRIHTRLADNRCLDASTGHGAQARMRDCGTVVSFTSLWVVRQHANGWHQWESLEYEGQCLDVRAHGTSNVVQLWDCLNQGNQKWQVF